MKKVKKIKSLEKALGILDCFTEARPVWGVSELARELGMPKSTVVTLLATMELCGYVEQNERTKDYRLALRLFELGYVVRDNMKIRSYVLPVLEELQQMTSEIVYLVIPRYGRVLYLESVYPTKRLVQYSTAGRLGPMHCTGVGKAMLAFMAEEDVDQIIKSMGLPGFTATTLTSPQALKDELKLIRQRGYAIDNGEHDSSIRCVAVPLIGEQGAVVGGISVSGSYMRFTQDAMESYAHHLMDAVTSIQRYIQFIPKSDPLPRQLEEVCIEGSISNL